PAGGLEVAHVVGDARVGLRGALQGQDVAFLLERGQDHAVGDGAHQRIEQVDHLRAVGLQLLDHGLAVQQPLLLLVELGDFLVLLLDLADLGAQEVVALVLAADFHVVVEPHQDRQQDAAQGGGAEHGLELARAMLAALGAPRQGVEACDQSKLLRARPVAIISAGASWASACACTRGPRVICANGLATWVGTPSCSSTISGSPAMEAQPPASTIWSTRLNSLPA